jgi:hypothetical protein
MRFADIQPQAWYENRTMTHDDWIAGLSEEERAEFEREVSRQLASAGFHPDGRRLRARRHRSPIVSVKAARNLVRRRRSVRRILLRRDTI